VIARSGGFLRHLRDVQADRTQATLAAAAQGRLPGGPSLPHHRATRALLGETVKALNSADPGAPWTIERDGSWSSADVFDYAVYRRRDGGLPARVGVEVHPGAGLDTAQAALGISAAYTAGGGLYDGVLVIAEALDDISAARLGELVARMTSVPCTALGLDARRPDAGTAHDDDIIRVAEALDRLTGGDVPDARETRHAAPTPRPAAAPEPRDAATVWSAGRGAAEGFTVPLGTSPSASDDFAALLSQASTDDPAPSRRSRSPR
jgi:hypothetical protein